MRGDPGELQAIAQRMRVEADEVREVAGQVGSTADVRWRSPAADLFRERVDDRAGSLRRVAGQVEEAADLLVAHARAVAGQLARAEELAGDLAGVLRQVWRG